MVSPEKLEEIQAQAFICAPTDFNGICQIYPLTMAEILRIGFQKYNRKLGLLLLTEIEIQQIVKEKIKEEVPLEEIYPLNFLLQSANQNDGFFLELKDAFSTFIKEDILLIPELNAILVNPDKPEQKKLITEENFKDFQNILRIQNRREITSVAPEKETFGQRKMRLLREKVAAAKKKQAEKKSGKSSMVDLLEIASVFGIDLEKCSFFAFQRLIARHQMREKYLADIQMLCAGADSDKLKIKYWGESSKD